MLDRKQRISQILNQNLQPISLEVKNNSYLHKGHLGDDGTMETHFEILIECHNLKALGRIKSHQKIMQLLKPEFAQGLHALEIKIK